MKILIGADLVPTESNIPLFCKGDALSLVGDSLLQYMKKADYRIFNLEVPLTDVSSPIDKCGPALLAPVSAIAGYRALGVDCLTIANNHIMDQGEQGFCSTISTLKCNGISYVGGGKNLSEAARSFILTVEDKKIGIYACAEHEFSIAGEDAPGANPFDPLESPDHVAELKKQCDFVIVLYHGGKEHYRYPSPNLQKVCRKLIEKGADLVVCQHSHCVGCEEKYQGGTIVYGQGNFLFDHSESEFWQTSLLVQIGDGFEISYIPLEKAGNVVRLSNKPEVLEAFHGRSREILQPGFIEKHYGEFADKMLTSYLLAFSGKKLSIPYRIINKLSGYRFASWHIKKKYGKKNLLAIRNFTECEAHSELLIRGIIACFLK